MTSWIVNGIGNKREQGDSKTIGDWNSGEQRRGKQLAGHKSVAVASARLYAALRSNIHTHLYIHAAGEIRMNVHFAWAKYLSK